jgi:hypothetical protein
MASLTDIPPELLDRPNRIQFLNWIANLGIPEERIYNQLISLYTKATGMHFSGLDYQYLNNTIHLNAQKHLNL